MALASPGNTGLFAKPIAHSLNPLGAFYVYFMLVKFVWNNWWSGREIIIILLIEIHLQTKPINSTKIGLEQWQFESGSVLCYCNIDAG